jgi:hypothetical protein
MRLHEISRDFKTLQDCKRLHETSGTSGDFKRFHETSSDFLDFI